MKDKKTLVIILFIFAIILIGIGIGTNFLSNSVDNNEDEPVVENRNYKTVVALQPATINEKTTNKSEFVTLIDSIGFEDSNCDETTDINSSTYCTATNKGYENSELTDHIILSHKENKIEIINLMLYFYESDFTEDKIETRLNSVINNFYGTKITKKQIKEVKDGLANNSKENVFIKSYTSGSYTIELNMQQVEKEKFYLVRCNIIDNVLYNSQDVQ